ncbi:L-type lectin-domain containing receptor kinase IX.1-like [Cucumis melo var. makuwa]|nr:L-type lectin-domain containing receptor kinase IX.1-like [Cucumis melo var. makuwa]TYK22116.1 L-type lectin-domain containing receptor kinase IX.1-like [Cucumis melo var. makuwa]
MKNNNNSNGGLAFFLAPFEFSPPLNSSPSFLGLYNSTQLIQPSQSQILHVEFDTFPNPEWDPPFKHIGINKNSISSSIYSPWNSTNQKTLVWISYNSTAKNLSVSFNNENNNNYTTLSLQIDLMEILPEKVTIGFSAALVEDLSIEFWEFSSNLDGNYENDNEKSTDMNLLAVLIAWVGVFVIAIISIIIISLIRKKKKDDYEEHGAMKLASIYSDLNKEEALKPRRFSYTYLAMATDNFAKKRKLGEGGFGEVFEARLPGANKTVAVKKIFKSSRQGKREYISEVKIINGMKHKNLVQLIGWCHESSDDSEFLLVYEFMPNGTLHSHLFGDRPPLSWPIRYKISLGLASALLYLHEERENSVVHRDIKSSNVLLDSDFTAKLSDFGLARLAKHELNSKRPKLVGTFGYMAPEYISSRQASKESDIFSYGVVLLEIVSGKKCCDHSGKGLIELAWDAYGRGELVKAILDKKLGVEFVEEREVERLSMVGLWCVHPDSTQRPSIKQVIQVLSFQEAMPNLPLEMPLPTFNHASWVYKLNVAYPEENLSMTCNLNPLRS